MYMNDYVKQVAEGQLAAAAHCDIMTMEGF